MAERIVRALIALAAWGGLGIQLWILLTSGAFDTPLAAVWRFLAFFTILTNLMVAVVNTVAALAPASASGRLLAGANTRVGVALYIATVGVIYHLLLAGLATHRRPAAAHRHARAQPPRLARLRRQARPHPQGPAADHRLAARLHDLRPAARRLRRLLPLPFHRCRRAWLCKRADERCGPHRRLPAGRRRADPHRADVRAETETGPAEILTSLRPRPAQRPSQAAGSRFRHRWRVG